MSETDTRLPAPVLPRPRTLLVGTTLAIAATLMYFAGLFGIYLQQRSLFVGAGQDWLAGDADIQLTPPSMVLWTLILSAFTVQWAVYSIARDDRRHTYMAIGITILFGMMTLNQTAFQYIQMGLEADNSRAAVLIYTISGSHMAMTVVGMIFLGLTGFRALAGQYSSRHTDGISAAAMWWYALIVVYAVMWYAIFVTK